VEALMKLIRLTHLDLIQMRNLNIDPDLYLQAMGKGKGIGIAKMMRLLKEEFPTLQFGYFNRTKERFHAHGDRPFRRNQVAILLSRIPAGRPAFGVWAWKTGLSSGGRAL
jgi:hypothetical protein